MKQEAQDIRKKFVCKAVGNSKPDPNKHKDEAVKDNGPVISRKAIIVCAISVVISAVITVAVLVYGYRPDDMIKDTWKTYLNGEEMTFVCDGAKATFADSDGCETVNDYTIDGNTVTFNDGEHTQVYIWSGEASSFIADHEYGESQQIIANKAEEIENFKGYMTVDGDFLYLGSMCMCRESAMEGYTDTSPVGEWTGAAGDKLTITADGGYHYIDCGLTYDGSYSIDKDGRLNLKLGEDTITLDTDNWGIEGRVLQMSSQYYFRSE